MHKRDKEQKKLLKEERKQQKQQKREKFNQLITAAKELNIQFDPESDKPKFVDAFNSVWPILQPALEYAQLIRITGPKADIILKTVTELGNRISTGQASIEEQSIFIQKYISIWSTVSQALEIIKTFTDEKADTVIDKVLDIGDWIADPIS